MIIIPYLIMKQKYRRKKALRLLRIPIISSNAIITNKMKLIKRLQDHYPNIVFKAGEENLWLPNKKTIIFRPSDEIGLLHELGHALCGHTDFNQDIELLHAERDAWDKAVELSKIYGVNMDENRIETAMDWYRNWLHARSLCPECGQNGIQQRSTGNYKCLNCATIWQSSDARMKELRRHKL